MIRVFEAIYFHIGSRLIARAFHFFFCVKKGDTDWAYFSKRPEFDNLKMMGGLEDSVHNWKEYFWKVTIDALEIRLDYSST